MEYRQVCNHSSVGLGVGSWTINLTNAGSISTELDFLNISWFLHF